MFLYLLLLIVISADCMMCRRDEDYEHVTLADSQSELESVQLAEFEKVTDDACRLHSTSSLYRSTPEHWPIFTSTPRPISCH